MIVLRIIKKLFQNFKNYSYAYEELDVKLSQAFGPWLETTIMVDSDHAHDRITRRSITSLIAWVKSKQVIWFIHR